MGDRDMKDILHRLICFLSEWVKQVKILGKQIPKYLNSSSPFKTVFTIEQSLRLQSNQLIFYYYSDLFSEDKNAEVFWQQNTLSSPLLF